MQDQPQTDLRGLKALVAILGALIVLGTAVVVGTVIHRLYARVSAPPSMVVAVAPPPVGVAPLAVGAALAKGERIEGIAGAGGDVAVWVNGPAGDRVLLLDPATGRVSVGLSAAP
jgi:hypothetical protein